MSQKNSDLGIGGVLFVLALFLLLLVVLWRVAIYTYSPVSDQKLKSIPKDSCVYNEVRDRLAQGTPISNNKLADIERDCESSKGVVESTKTDAEIAKDQLNAL